MIKTLYFMFLAAACMIVLTCCSLNVKDDFKNLSADEFERYIQKKDIQCVDVRTAAEYSQGHIPNSLNINVKDETFTSIAEELLDKNRTVAVYCKSGRRSRNAAQLLTEKGFKVVNLDKGYVNWKELGKEIAY